MKLLYHASDLEEASQLKATLETAGIPAMISGENFSSLRIPLFPDNHGVFIYLDEQYNDALRLISDPGYIPETAIDVEQFYELMDSETVRRNINKGYLVILGWVLVILILLFMLLEFLLY